MIILVKLILAHLLGDFFLQPASWVEQKERLKAKSPKLYIHAGIHGILILILLWDRDYILLALVVTLLHFLIDLTKLHFQNQKTKTQWFVGDQLLHLGSILIIWHILFQPDITLLSLIHNINLLTIGTGILFLTLPASIILSQLLRQWSESIADDSGQSLQNAGKYIGILERLFVFVFVLTGHWESVGFLIAAKSVFRFGDLKESKERKLTEYILIGTLMSFGIAILVGIIAARFYR